MISVTYRRTVHCPSLPKQNLKGPIQCETSIFAAGKQCSDPHSLISGFIIFPIIDATSVLNLHAEPGT